MTITIYTIANDQFCTAAKDYLTGQGLTFEEKNLETNRQFLAEMLAASDNFAGVPFTIIIKDDGMKVTLKGFTKEEFDAALAVSPTPAPTPPPASVTPIPPVTPPAPAPETPVPTPPTPAATPVPAAPQKELEGVLNTLSSMSTPPTAPQPPSQDLPTIPDFTPTQNG